MLINIQMLTVNSRVKVSVVKMIRIQAIETRGPIEACQVIPTYEKAVENVVYNSIEARANVIQVQLDVNARGFVVTDDGVGIDADSLYSVIGQENTASDTGHGRVLVALSQLSIIEIQSRVSESWNSFSKRIEFGRVTFNGRQNRTLQHQNGTRVSVTDLFQQLPVRQRILSRPNAKKRILRHLKQFCLDLFLLYPDVAVEIYDKGSLPFYFFPNNTTYHVYRRTANVFEINTLCHNSRSISNNLRSISGCSASCRSILHLYSHDLTLSDGGVYRWRLFSRRFSIRPDRTRIDDRMSDFRSISSVSDQSTTTG